MNTHADNWFNGVEPPAMDDAFDVGDVVSLLSGSPPLTVLNVCDCGTVEVAWFDGYSLSVVDLPEEALVHWDGSDD